MVAPVSQARLVFVHEIVSQGLNDWMPGEEGELDVG